MFQYFNIEVNVVHKQKSDQKCNIFSEPIIGTEYIEMGVLFRGAYQ